jgi:hypothetical protein
MGDSQTVPVDRIRIFDRTGSPVAEFRASAKRSYVVGDTGRLQFQYPARKTDVVNEDVLVFGNWILVQNSVLPPWIGVLDTPRTWSSRNVVVSAYTPERAFGWRIGPLEEVLTGSAGTIFEKLLQKVNIAEPTILRAGSIWRGGTQRQMTVNPSPLNEYLQELWERSGEDYTWGASITADGKLLVYGHWFPFLGAETGVLLHEGIGGGNIEATGTVLVEDGPIVNSVFAYGEGETWQSKPNVTVTQAPSVGKYGLRQEGVEYSGVADMTTLQENGKQHVLEFRRPARSFSVTAINVGDTFKHIKLGNIFTLQLQSVGFTDGQTGYTSRVRIVGMSFNPETPNKIQLVVREVL